MGIFLSARFKGERSTMVKRKIPLVLLLVTLFADQVWKCSAQDELQEILEDLRAEQLAEDSIALNEEKRDEQLLLSAAILGKKFVAGKTALGSAAASGIANTANSFLQQLQLADLSTRNHICLHTCRNSPEFETCINLCRTLIGLPRFSFDDSNIIVEDPPLPEEEPEAQSLLLGLGGLGRLRPDIIPGRPCRRICRTVLAPRRRRRCVNICRRYFGRSPLSLEDFVMNEARDAQQIHAEGSVNFNGDNAVGTINGGRFRNFGSGRFGQSGTRQPQQFNAGGLVNFHGANAAGNINQNICNEPPQQEPPKPEPPKPDIAPPSWSSRHAQQFNVDGGVNFHGINAAGNINQNCNESPNVPQHSSRQAQQFSAKGPVNFNGDNAAGNINQGICVGAPSWS